jgi:tripartite-type tricarboxylate transporter receptor subunit TctC
MTRRAFWEPPEPRSDDPQSGSTIAYSARENVMPNARYTERTMTRFLAVVSLAGLLLSITPPGEADAEADYPSRTIRIVTPLAAGAASDTALRILADKLSARLGVAVIVQNQPGGGGVIAERSVTNAAADGYTLGWVGNNNAVDVSLYSAAVDPRQQMTPIVGVSEFAYLFVTNTASQYKTLQDYITAARAKPGTLSVGTSSAGTSNYLAALLFKWAQKLDITVVPYRGPSELSVALLRNDVDIVVNAYGGLRSALDAKQIRALAVTSAARLPELPEVPTMKEAGVPDFEVTSWNSLYGPKDMPQQAVETLAKAATEILNQPDVIAQYKAIGFDARPIQAGPLDDRMRFEIDRWGRVIKDAGISKQ